MNISEANDMVARLLDEESPEEFKNKLPGFYDHAQKQIATTVANIEGVFEFVPDTTKEYDISDVVRETIGKTMYKLNRVIAADGLSAERVYGRVYKLFQGVTYRVFCYVYPDTIDLNTDEHKYQFEVREEAIPALIYYAAAHVVATESDKAPYYMFMDRYNNILQNISDSKHTTASINIVKLGGVSGGI